MQTVGRKGYLTGAPIQRCGGAVHRTAPHCVGKHQLAWSSVLELYSSRQRCLTTCWILALFDHSDDDGFHARRGWRSGGRPCGRSVNSLISARAIHRIALEFRPRAGPLLAVPTSPDPKWSRLVIEGPRSILALSSTSSKDVEALTNAIAPSGSISAIAGRSLDSAWEVVGELSSKDLHYLGESAVFRMQLICPIRR